ncbi:MAG: 3'-5' exonuclease [Treponema sp.]|nr:3'-5' exonuclease [Treponema sp.]
MNHKNFVFFDCECANTFEGVGKICSLGYVICDDDLNVIESEDVVMNPECEFDWYLFSGKGGIKLAYSKDYFRIKPNYESYYKDIKKLFTTGNRYIAGFAVSNDVGFVNDANERYNLPYIQFRAFDLERYLERKYGKKQKLVEWAQEFGVNIAKFQSHKSVDDAMMTMLCLKAECMKSGISVEALLTSKEGRECFVSNEQILEQAAERAYRKEMKAKIERLYGKFSPKPRFKTILGNKYELDKKVLRDVDYAFELVKQIYDNGGATFEHVGGGSGQSKSESFIVFENLPDNPNLLAKLKDRGVKAISLEELESVLK